RELFMILRQYIDMIRIWELDNNKRARKLSLSGGEPLLRKDFFKLLEEIQNNKWMFTSLVVMSNGSLITKDVARKLNKNEVSGVQISLEGTEEFNDRIRGKGAFKKAVNGIKILMDFGLTTGVSLTAHRKNYRDLPNLIDFLRDLGVKLIGIGRLVPIGMGESLEMLNPKELKDFYSLIMAKKKELEKEGVRMLAHCSDSLWLTEDKNYETHGCSAGYDSFSILPNGDVVPCRRFPVKVGNVLEKSLIDIWYTSDFLWKLRNKGNVSACKDCEFFKKCFGGARCVAYGYFNDVFASDPQCWRLFNSLPEKTTPPVGKDDTIVFNEAYTESFDPKTYFDKMSDV
ncbi:MAG: radical SAM protein, partial [Candidatus Aenigmatarchaeota archaeon]